MPTRHLIAAAAAVLPLLAHADALTDLRATLARLPGTSALSARVQVQGERRGGGDTTKVAGSVQVDDGPGGLKLAYPAELMARLLAQQRAAAATPADQSPPRDTAAATLSELEPVALRPLIHAGAALAATLERAQCGPVKDSTWADKPARLLACTLRRPAMNERERGYVKQHEGKLDIWLAADGTPLATRRSETVSGRAFVVVSFEQQSSQETSYAVVGDRLVATRLTQRQSGSGAGEKGDSQTVWTLSAK